MLNVINNALRNNNYYICMYPDHVYVYHYEEIIGFNDSNIILKIKNFNIVIKGKNLHILKMENGEILIKGLISGVMYE